MSACIVAVLCFFSHEPSFTAEPSTLLELTIDKIKVGSTVYSYQDVIGWFDNSMWFYVILPVILSLPAVSDLSAEWFSSGYYFNIHRQSVFGYAAAKSLAYSLCSVICFLAGVMVFIVSALLVFPSADAETISLLYPDGFWLHILSRLLNSLALAATYPLICILAVILIKEKFLSLSIPMLINYMTSLISSNLLILTYRHEEPFYEKLAMLTPFMQSRQYGSFERVYGLPIFVWYLAWAVFLALLVTAFYFLVKRRSKTDA